jgi:hypothetical protein
LKNLVTIWMMAGMYCVRWRTETNGHEAYSEGSS